MANWKIANDAGLAIEGESAKITTMESLLSNPSAQILKFAVEVIADESENWLVRSETCRLIRDIEFDGWEDIGLCKPLYDILSDDSEDLTLRQWSAFLVNKCQSNSDLADLISKIIVQSDDLRWNIIDSLSDADTISTEIRDSLHRKVLGISVDTEVRKAIADLLS